MVELVTEYLDGALDDVRRAEVGEHLADCADCLAYLGQIEQTVAAVRALLGDAGEL
jgi:anti-sigma factor RsiW